MRLSVKVKPNAKTSLVKTLENNMLEVYVNAPAKDGKANDRLLDILSEYFKKPKSKIKLLKGQSSKIKLLEIEDG